MFMSMWLSGEQLAYEGHFDDTQSFEEQKSLKIRSSEAMTGNITRHMR